MQSETLPARTQPGEPSDVASATLEPCHTGKAALSCGFCIELFADDLVVDCTCISCGAPWGQPHAPDCPQKSFWGT